jgi:hypothetical protein
MRNFQLAYEERLNKLRKEVETTELYEEVQLKNISSEMLEEMYDRVESITGQRPTEEFNFPSLQGLMGLLRRMSFSFKHYKELAEEFGISIDLIKEYRTIVGSTPYKTKEGTVYPAVYPQLDKVKEYVKLCASQLGIIVDDYQLKDFDEDRIKELYARRQRIIDEETKVEETFTADDIQSLLDEED